MRRHPPAAGRAAAGNHRPTAGQSPEEADVLELIRRQLDEDRRQALHQAVGARHHPQPHLLRRGSHVGLDRAGERRCRPPDMSPGSWRRLRSSSSMAEMGPISGDQGRGRRGGRSAGGQEAADESGERGARPPMPRQRTAIWQRDAEDLCRPGVHHRHRGRRAAAGGRRATACTTCRRKRIYSWDPGAHFGIYKPDCFWIDPANRPRPPTGESVIG